MEFGLLTLKAAAAHIHMDELELKHFAQREEVPASKRGDEFFFEHRLLDEWAQRRMLALKPKQLTGEHRTAMHERLASGEVHVASLVPEGGIRADISARNKGGVLRDMTELADATGLVYDKDALFHGLVEREAAASTAVAGGTALLHVRFHDAYLYSDSFLVLGRTPRPVFFGDTEGAGTDIFFLVCCTDHALHLHVLARLCLLARNTPLLENLRAAPDADAMRAALAAAENDLLGTLR